MDVKTYGTQAYQALVQRARKAVNPPGEARNEREIICEVATKMGNSIECNSAARIVDGIAPVTPIYGGYRSSGSTKWASNGLVRSSDREHPDTRHLHVGRFTRGEGKFHAVEFKSPAELPGESFSFVLSTGRKFHRDVHTPVGVEALAVGFVRRGKVNIYTDPTRIRLDNNGRYVHAG